MNIKKVIWDLNRFGFLSIKRIYKKEKRRNILINSIPKSGTHLLERLICLLPYYYRPMIPTLTEQNLSKYHGKVDAESSNLVYVSHLERREIEKFSINIFQLFLMIRDPRAVLKSRMAYIKNEEDHLFRNLVGDVENRSNLFQKCLHGVEGTAFYSINEMFNKFYDCIEISHVIKFEDLIGGEGGGDDKRMEEEITTIIELLDFEKPEKLADKLKTKVFSESSPTFNDPGISKWKKEFSKSELNILESYLEENFIYKEYYQIK